MNSNSSLLSWVNCPVEVASEVIFGVDTSEFSVSTANDVRGARKDWACCTFEATLEEFEFDDDGLVNENGWEIAGLTDDLCQSSDEVSSGDIEEPTESTDEGGGVSIGRDW